MAPALKHAIDVIFDAFSHTLGYVPGVRTFQTGPLRGRQYDKPLWWETEGFLAVDVPPEDVIAAIRAYKPGPHLIGVACEKPDEFLEEYETLGYRTYPNEPIEIVMALNLAEFRVQPANKAYPVQLVRTEADRQFYNSAIDPGDPHQQMRAEELWDPKLRYYFVEQDGRCVCTGKAIFPCTQSVVIEPLGTHLDYRRLGIATALMRRLLADAIESGAKESVILASEMGRALYVTLGYEVVGYKQKFIPSDHQFYRWHCNHR